MIRSGTISVIAAFIGASTASAQEKKITRADLPAAVERAVVAQSQGATIRGFTREIEDGKTSYEAEMTVNGHSKDISMDSAGTVLEVEEEVALDSLPAAVRTALTTLAGQGRIGKVESLTKHGQLVAYEAHVTTNGKRSEIQVGPDGKKLEHEE
jgi:hypothetical protein